MESWEKEASYMRIYSSGQHVRNLWKYIPKKVRPGVADAFADSDGYWVLLETGWLAYDYGDDCGVIHEYNIRDLQDAVRHIKKV